MPDEMPDLTPTEDLGVTEGYRVPIGSEPEPKEEQEEEPRRQEQVGIEADGLTFAKVSAMPDKALLALAEQYQVPLTDDMTRAEIEEVLGSALKLPDLPSKLPPWESLPPALQGHLVQLSKDLGEARYKAELVDRLFADPETVLREAGRMFGFEIKPVQAMAEPTKPQPKADDFKTLPEYVDALIEWRMTQTGKAPGPAKPPKEVQAAQSQALQAQRSAKVERVISYLGEKFPDWGVYEPEISALARQDPRLLDQPDRLYQTGKAQRLAARGKEKSHRVAEMRKAGGEHFATGERGGQVQDLAGHRGVGILGTFDAARAAKAELTRRGQYK